MVPEYIIRFLFGFLKKLIDLSVQMFCLFVCLFVYICLCQPYRAYKEKNKLA